MKRSKIIKQLIKDNEAAAEVVAQKDRTIGSIRSKNIALQNVNQQLKDDLEKARSQYDAEFSKSQKIISLNESKINKKAKELIEESGSYARLHCTSCGHTGVLKLIDIQ